MGQTIESLESGMHVEGFYLLKDASVKITTSGKPFLTGTLMDKTGTVEFKIWDYSGPVNSADAGNIIKIRGEANEYRGTLQIIGALIRRATPSDPYDVNELVPTAPIDKQGAFLQVRELLSQMKDPDYRNLCETMLDRHEAEFRNIPAAKSVHHSFLNGLLMHTSYMMRAAAFYADLYAEIVDRDLLLAGTFLHDLAKREEFLFSELGIVTDYSRKGYLVGHLVLGAEDVAEVGKELRMPEDKILLLQHLILSHHGKPEFGAAVRPMCAEAELLSYIDMIDSRMEIYREAYQEMEPGTFSERIFALENKVFKHE